MGTDKKDIKSSPGGKFAISIIEMLTGAIKPSVQIDYHLGDQDELMKGLLSPGTSPKTTRKRRTR
ncbi:MAG: hypothetical protein WAZ27_03750 [Minisyncoccia bacterium]